MKRTGSDKRNWRIIVLTVLFFLGALAVSSVFFRSRIVDASDKEFWVDETFGLESSARPASYVSLLLDGAPGQGSPAPFDYIVIKFFDSIKEQVNYLSLPPAAYFRLPANSVTLLSLWLVLLVFFHEIVRRDNEIGVKTGQLFLLFCVSLAYLYAPDVYAYATEMRPYALWNSLWFVAGALSLLRPGTRIPLLLSLSMLALSATAAVFQIIALTLALVTVRLALEKDKPADVIKEAALLFIAPFLIALYYSSKAPAESGYTGPEWGTWAMFWDFWRGKFERFYAVIAVMVLCLLRRDTRKHMVLPLAMTIMFFIGPVIYWVTRSKGFFFTPRQYIYYDLTKTVVLLTMIQCLPSYVKSIRNRRTAIAVIVFFCLLGAGSSVGKKTFKLFVESCGKGQHPSLTVKPLSAPL